MGQEVCIDYVHTYPTMKISAIISWHCSLIINDCIDSGTQLPYIQRAIKVSSSSQNTETRGWYTSLDLHRKATV